MRKSASGRHTVDDKIQKDCPAFTEPESIEPGTYAYRNSEHTLITEIKEADAGKIQQQEAAKASLEASGFNDKHQMEQIARQAEAAQEERERERRRQAELDRTFRDLY